MKLLRNIINFLFFNKSNNEELSGNKKCDHEWVKGEYDCGPGTESIKVEYCKKCYVWIQDVWEKFQSYR